MSTLPIDSISPGDTAAGRRETVATKRTKPTPFVRIVMRPMTRMLNPAIRLAAGRKHVRMVAQIRHRGRHSGRVYVTPASARVVGDAVFIPLTFGSSSQWCRNIQAAGGCTIRWKGREYVATEPQLLERRVALSSAGSAFTPLERIMLGALGITQFLHLRVLRAGDAGDVGRRWRGYLAKTSWTGVIRTDSGQRWSLREPITSSSARRSSGFDAS